MDGTHGARTFPGLVQRDGAGMRRAGSNIVHAEEICQKQVHEYRFQGVAVPAHRARTPHSRVGMQSAVKGL